MNYEHQGRIATVTLNRPAKLNAMTRAMYDRLGKIFSTLAADSEVRCVVLRGAGDRAFCPGSDINEFDDVRDNVEQAKAYAVFVNAPTFAVRDCPHPTVALIRGVCVGGGLELAAACDLRIAGESSRFGIPINRLGLTADYDELQLLVEMVGAAAALEILLEGRLLSAQEALQKGLLSRVVPDERVEEEVYSVARRISETAPLVNRWHKKFIRRLREPRPLTPEERDEAFACFATEDYRIGRDAFAAKRTPEFRGR